MSATRQLTAPPGSLGLSLRAGLALVPGASALPFVAGGGKEIPDVTLTLSGARLDAQRLTDYARVCDFGVRDSLPVTAPHLLAFPLHMALMTDGSFPFPAVGLVHLSNRIVQHRPIAAAEALDVSVHATPLRPHPKGRTFSIVTEATAGSELVWEEHSTMLRRGGGGGAESAAGGGAVAGAPRVEDSSHPDLLDTADWRLPEDLGRRYGAVSGDRNPIHLHALSARLFGFSRAIAHGMWTKARCLAALESTLPDAYAVDVDFRKPIFLPGHVTFAEAREHEQTSFAVRSAKDHKTIHLEGTVTP
ncbi:MAG: MaoC family dehydratase [Solirubrobacteraceae bacterium]